MCERPQSGKVSGSKFQRTAHASAVGFQLVDEARFVLEQTFELGRGLQRA
jgi:hypothetical protein